MDPVTHTLTGLVLAQAGASQLGPSTALGTGAGAGEGRSAYATLALVVAANVPDIDFLLLLAGPAAYLEYRGLGHSLVGSVGLGAAVAVAFWNYAGRKRPRPQPLRPLLVVCLMGVLSHLLLDWSTSEGTAWLWPLKKTWYALDWFPYIDLWLLVILLLALAIPALFGLILEEIGVRRSERGWRRGAWVALAACAALAMGRASLHGEAVGQFESRMYRERSPRRAAASAVPLNPFRWHGVVETEDTYETAEVTLVGAGRGFEPSATYYKPAPTPALEAALRTQSARLFLAWARFPHAQLSPWAGGWRVRLEGLHTAPDAPTPGRFVAWIDVSQDLQVQEENLGFGRAAEEPQP